MIIPFHRFTFDRSVPMLEVESTLRLAVLTVECLHGEDRVRMETHYEVDLAKRACLIDTSTETGRTLAVVFGGYVRREFGDDMRFERVEPRQPVGAT